MSIKMSIEIPNICYTENTSERLKQNFLPFDDLFLCRKYNHEVYFILMKPQMYFFMIFRDFL